MDKKSTQKLKDHLRTPEELPQDYSWENIGSSVLDKMETRVVKKNLRTAKSIIYTLTIIVFSTIAYIYTNIKIDNDNIDNSQVELNQNYDSEQKAPLELNKSTSMESIDEVSINSTDSKGKKPQINSINNLTYATTLFNEDLIHVQKETESSSEKIAFQDNEAEGLRTALNKKTSHAPLLAGSLTANDKLRNSADPSINSDQGQTIEERLPVFIHTVGQIKALNHVLVLNNKRPAILMSSDFVSPSKEIIVQNKIDKFSLHFGVGTNYLSNGLQAMELNTDLRNISEKGLLGYSATLGIEYLLGPKWSFGISFSYDKHYSKLDYFNSFSSQVSSNVLVRREINSLTNEITEIFADRLLNQTSWEKVIHHNSYSYMNTEINMFYHMSISKKSSLNFGGGLQLNYLSQVDGKTLKNSLLDNRLYEVQNLDQVLLSRLSYGVSASINYQQEVGENHFVRIGMKSIIDLDSKEIDTGVSISPIRYRATVGVGFRF